jgi:hypothetical protein
MRAGRILGEAGRCMSRVRFGGEIVLRVRMTKMLHGTPIAQWKWVEASQKPGRSA